MNNKNQQIKNIVAKIDIEKITSYLQEHSSSKTLKQIVRFSKRVLDSSNDQEISRLAVRLAYNLEKIVNVSKYVKDEEEKKFLLELSEELFINTKGKKEIKL
jgi:hypothetical protein